MIPVFRPSYDSREVEALQSTLLSGWIGLGPKTKEFEEKFANFIGARYAVAMNSATAGLHLAMNVLGVSRHEVITTPMTFVSTNHAILYNDAVPVFCDIERDTLNIDAEKIEALVTKKTKMIVAVHFGGKACNLDQIQAIARKHNLLVLEDAAHACGGEFKGRKLGSIGNIAVFSFHAVKNLATGDGGMVVTDDKEVYEKLLKLRWVGISHDTWNRDQGKKYSWNYDVECLGFKYHMNDINATLGLVQLSKLEEMNDKRRSLSQLYDQMLTKFDWIERPVQKAYQTKSAAHNYVVKVPMRNQLNEFMASKGIATGVHYIPNNHYEMYKSYRGPTPVAHEVWERLLTLPLFPDLKVTELEYVVECLRAFGETLPAHSRQNANTLKRADTQVLTEISKT